MPWLHVQIVFKQPPFGSGGQGLVVAYVFVQLGGPPWVMLLKIPRVSMA